MADYRFETLNEREIVELQKATKIEISFIFKLRLLELKFYRGNYWLLWACNLLRNLYVHFVSWSFENILNEQENNY